MSRQQPDSDPWTSPKQSPWSDVNSFAVARARTDVLAHIALILHARPLLEEAMSAPKTPVRPFLIVVDHFRFAKTWRLF